jgi:hypothetical protein
MRHSRAAFQSIACCCVALAACAKSADKVADTTAVTTPSAATGASASSTASNGAIAAPNAKATPLSFASVKGKWNVRSTPTTGTDTSVSTYVIDATGDSTKWTAKYSNGLVVPLHVTIAGDSLVATTGAHKSLRRKGVEVTTNGSYRLVDGKLVGTSTAHYKTKGADSVLVLRVEGTRVP